MSLPAWERGLKSDHEGGKYGINKSLPAWERGLKSLNELNKFFMDIVAPCVGAWIEISALVRLSGTFPGRSLRGSVD